jgi:hypothetical protein
MDDRKNNGNKGHSTKAKGVDRRKNEYKTALASSSTVEEVEEVIKVLKAQAKEGDLAAVKLFLEYYLGRPTQEVLNTNVNIDEKELTKEIIDKIKNTISSEY